ncbi:MAG: pyrroline-5-carboxylate reductase [Bacillus sp. (in: firmicutes)]
MSKKIGFIGCGKMAQAMIAGMIQSSFLQSDDIIVSSKTLETCKYVHKTYKVFYTLDNKKVADFADIIILAVKPHLYADVMEEIKGELSKNTIVVTIAAGIDLTYMTGKLGKEAKIIRSMPNTPSLVGEGMTVFCSSQTVVEEELNYMKQLFSSFGAVEVMEEKIMDYIPAISGSSPAYVYLFIEALADGGVRSGIPREAAYKLAAQAVLGAAKMVLETGKHPGVLKDEVCTPGGATIEAIATLERKQFRGTILDAMESCDLKNIALNNK